MNITVSIYNVLRLPKLLRYLKQAVEDFGRPLRIYFSVVNSPEFLDLEILPIFLRKLAARELRALAYEFKTHPDAQQEIIGLSKLLRKQTYSESDIEGLRRDFRIHLDLFDQSRKTNLLDFIPELKELVLEKNSTNRPNKSIRTALEI